MEYLTQTKVSDWLVDLRKNYSDWLVDLRKNYSDWLVDLRKNYFFERYPFLNASRFISYLRVIIVTCTELREAVSIDCSRTAKLQIPPSVWINRNWSFFVFF